ncbi:response regulator [Ketobacter sp.]|uniref:response regulator n=1 Tax=Ketobacter sp. TaxID=2083498 RepID=UPI000F194D38|nr:response regulator transcription factor [Ketobacter sp.]RLU00663.1 MAG: DNA-binding response regulator [Ketobacter sp.]
MTENLTCTFLVIDDHPVFQDGIAVILSTLRPDATIVSALNGADGVHQAEQRPDLDWIFVDYQLPDCDGLSILEKLNRLMVTAPIVMMSGVDDLELVAKAMQLGVSGFIHKSGGKQVFKDCLETIEQGKVYLPAETQVRLEHYRHTVGRQTESIRKQLSSRRMDVLLLVAEGYSNQEIANSLSITEATVKSHVSALMSILDADSRYHCVAEARKLGLIK